MVHAVLYNNIYTVHALSKLILSVSIKTTINYWLRSINDFEIDVLWWTSVSLIYIFQYKISNIVQYIPKYKCNIQIISITFIIISKVFIIQNKTHYKSVVENKTVFMYSYERYDFVSVMFYQFADDRSEEYGSWK